jgi:hypothetical protein
MCHSDSEILDENSITSSNNSHSNGRYSSCALEMWCPESSPPSFSHDGQIISERAKNLTAPETSAV